MFSSDMKRTMALIGCTTVKEVNRDFVALER
jgi:isopentenyl diphosphate isomerase/L-lactate dehydrogenase-like FMN-dependent dehydrogenase